MPHDHDHASLGNLKTAFFLNLAFTIVEIFGGIFTNSVSILADAIHDLGDSLSLGMAWVLQKKSQKKADRHFSFGYARLSLFGALLNSIILITGSVFIVYEAVSRFLQPQTSDAAGMLFFALGGILVNGYAAWKMSSGKTLNERIISWHLIEDVLGWAAVFVVSVVLLFKDLPFLDPALSILITLYVLYNVIKRLKETLVIFMQATPTDISMAEIEKKIKKIEGVHGIHHTHIWSLDGTHHVFSTHIRLEAQADLDALLRLKGQIKEVLKEYPFSHCTVQTELPEEECELEDDAV